MLSISKLLLRRLLLLYSCEHHTIRNADCLRRVAQLASGVGGRPEASADPVLSHSLATWPLSKLETEQDLPSVRLVSRKASEDGSPTNARRMQVIHAPCLHSPYQAGRGRRF